MRARFLYLLLVLLPVVAAADENPLGMSYVETKDLKLIYFDPLAYLAPYAVRTFTNSLEWQRRMFGWVPSERTFRITETPPPASPRTAGWSSTSRRSPTHSRPIRRASACTP